LPPSDPPEKRAKGETGEIDRLRPEALQDQGLFAPESPQLVLTHLGYSCVIAGPSKYLISKSFHLPPPLLVVFTNLVGANEKDVDVAVETAIAPGRGSENRSVEWCGIPKLEPASQALEEPRAQVRQLGDGFSRQVIPIQSVDMGPSGLLFEDEAMVDEPSEHSLRGVLGTVRQFGHLSPRPRLGGSREDAKYPTVNSRQQRLEWLRKIHPATVTEISAK
jgi:hypothetical protein